MHYSMYKVSDMKFIPHKTSLKFSKVYLILTGIELIFESRLLSLALYVLEILRVYFYPYVTVFGIEIYKTTFYRALRSF